MKKYFVISDIHGMFELFEKMLKNWNPNESDLVLLGDFVDRGPNSKEVLEKVYELKNTYPEQVHLLLGNHDDMFLNAIKETDEYFETYISWGGLETMHSFLSEFDEDIKKKEPTIIVDLMKKHYSHLIDMLKYDTHFYLVKGDILFTHAGFQSMFDDFRNSKETDFNHIRHHYKYKNNTGLLNVFGHTLTRLINSNGSNNVWISDDGTYIGIDGGACFGGQLNAILLSEEGSLLEKYVEKSVEV